MEAPRIAGAIQATRKTCVKCPNPFGGQFGHVRGSPLKDDFSLFQPGNPFGGVICEGRKESNAPPGYKTCRVCKRYKLLEMFRCNRKSCRPCCKKGLERRQEKRRAVGLKIRTEFTEEDDKIFEECVAKKLTVNQIREVRHVS
jgi:hypothetical protein